MFNLLEIMRQAQGGAAVDTMARQFGLSQEQTQRALEALLPAFAMAFQRSAANPDALAQLFGGTSSGRQAGFFPDALQGYSPQAQTQGNDILAQLFGSKDVSRQVAGQAAAMTGIGTDILKQMLPYMASFLMSGMLNTVARHGLSGFFGQLSEIFKGGWPGPAGTGARPGSDAPGGFGPWGDMLDGILKGGFGSAAPAPQEAAAERPGSFQKEVGDMLGGDKPQGMPGAHPQEAMQGGTPDAPQELSEFWSKMFQTGQEVQQQHMENLQNIFDSVRKAGPQSR